MTVSVDVLLSPQPGAADSSTADVVVVVDLLLGTTLACWALDEMERLRLADLPGDGPAFDERAPTVAQLSDLAEGRGPTDAVLVAPDLLRACELFPDSHVLLASAQNARVAAIRALRFAGEGGTVMIVAAGNDGAPAAEDAWLCGVLVHVLLDEASDGIVMSDAAGLAISLVPAYASPRQALEAGVRARSFEPAVREVALGLAASVDSVPVVPLFARAADGGGILVAAPLTPPMGRSAGEGSGPGSGATPGD